MQPTHVTQQNTRHPGSKKTFKHRVPRRVLLVHGRRRVWLTLGTPPTPLYPPHTTNHSRMVQRETRRQLIKTAAKGNQG